MAWLGVAGIIIALAFFIIFAMRGWNVMIIAPITAIIIVLTNQLDFSGYMLGTEASYLTGLGGFVTKNFPIFLLAALLGKYIDRSGAARSIAAAILKVTGKDNPFLVLIGVALVGAILTYGGVALFVVMFALIPLARPIFKECNMPWHLFAAAFAVGCTTFTMVMIPGTPAAANVVAANACGVTVTSAAGLGILAAVIVAALSVVYFKIITKKAMASGAGFDCKLPEAAIDPNAKTPHVAVALTPLVVLILIIIIGSACKVPNVVYIGLVVGIVLCAILFHKNIDGNHRDVLGDGAKDSLGPILFTAAGVGIGTIISASSGFVVIQNAINAMPGGTLVSAATLSFILGGCLGTGTGALGIMSANFLAPYLASGVNPAVLYKVIAIAATTGGAMPNAGSMFGMFNAMGLTHKEAYKHMFWPCIVFTLVALIVVIAIGSFM